MPDKQPVPPDLRAALACRNWIELHLHELWQAPRGLEVLGTFDVLAWADQRSAPEGAGEALAALVRVAQFDEPGIDAHLAQFDLAEPDASWLAQVGKRVRERLAEEPDEGLQPGLEAPITATIASPEFHLKLGRPAMTLVLISHGRPVLRIKEPTVGHLETAAMILDQCANAYELCEQQSIPVAEAETTDLARVLQRLASAARRIRSAMGLPAEPPLTDSDPA